jgi:hypothetical protein
MILAAGLVIGASRPCDLQAGHAALCCVGVLAHPIEHPLLRADAPCCVLLCLLCCRSTSPRSPW